MKSTRKTYVKTDDGFSLANKIFIKHGTDTVAVSSMRAVLGNWDIHGVPAPEVSSSLVAIVQQPSAGNDYYTIARLMNPDPPPRGNLHTIFTSPRGLVTTIQQPNPDNDYYAIVRLIDYHGGEHFFDASFRYGSNPGSTVLRFQGNVDHVLYIKFRVMEATSRSVTASGGQSTLESAATAAGCHYQEDVEGYDSEGWHGDLSATITLTPVVGTTLQVNYNFVHGPNNDNILNFQGGINELLYIKFRAYESDLVSVTATGISSVLKSAALAGGAHYEESMDGWPTEAAHGDLSAQITITPLIFPIGQGDESGPWKEAINVFQKFNNEWELVHCPGCVIVWAVTFPYFDKGSNDFHYEEPNLLDYIMSKSPPWPREIFGQAHFKIIVTIESGVEMLGPFTINGFSSGTFVHIYNSGTISGRAGRGGSSMAPYRIPVTGPPNYSWLKNWSDIYGEDGSDAILSDNDITITNSGTLQGGSGGGHGGMPILNFKFSGQWLANNTHNNFPTLFMGPYPWGPQHYHNQSYGNCDWTKGWLVRRGNPLHYPFPNNVNNLALRQLIVYDIQHGASGGGGAGYGSLGGEYPDELYGYKLEYNRNMLSWYPPQYEGSLMFYWGKLLSNIIYPWVLQGRCANFSFNVGDLTATNTGQVTVGEDANVTSGSISSTATLDGVLLNRRLVACGPPYPFGEQRFRGYTAGPHYYGPWVVNLKPDIVKDGGPYGTTNQYATWYWKMLSSNWPKLGPTRSYGLGLVDGALPNDRHQKAAGKAGTLSTPGAGGVIFNDAMNSAYGYAHNPINNNAYYHGYGRSSYTWPQTSYEYVRNIATTYGQYVSANGKVVEWLGHGGKGPAPGWKNDGGKGGELGQPGESYTVPSVTISRFGQDIVLPEITIKGGDVGYAITVKSGKSITILVQGTMHGGLNTGG